VSGLVTRTVKERVIAWPLPRMSVEDQVTTGEVSDGTGLAET
jgi:hypothetical protein